MTPTSTPALHLALEGDDLDGWIQSVDEHGSVVLQMPGPVAHTRTTFRAAVLEGTSEDLEVMTSLLVAELQTLLSDCLLIEAELLLDGPFRDDVAQVTLAFRVGLHSCTYFQWVCATGTEHIVTASLVCESGDAPIMAIIGPALLGSLKLLDADAP